MMDDAAIIALFLVNVGGIAALWSAIDEINKRIGKLTERLIECGSLTTER